MMKGQEIIRHILRAEMPDMTEIRGACTHQAMHKPTATCKRALYCAAACVALTVAIMLISRLSGGTVAFALSVQTPINSLVLMEDRSGIHEPNAPSTSVSYVDNGPELRFFVTGENIASVEVSCENEYLMVNDFTEKLDENLWNPELYYAEQEIDGAVYQYVPTESLLEKSHVVIFPEGFQDYDQVQYNWMGQNLRNWASQDNYAHIQLYDGLSHEEVSELLKNASEEERLAIASGGGETSAAGHILLDGYPEDKLKDKITIIITDRQGNKVTKMLAVAVTNNIFGQTVVTADLVN